MLNFYEKLAPMKNFDSFIDHGFYSKMPANWIMFNTEVLKSGKIIDAGKYKEVNLIAAASITVCIKAVNSRDFPYTFNGTGASICVPPNFEESVELELVKLRNLAKVKYGLTLRVSKVPIQRAYDKNLLIFVAKYQLNKSRNIAFFKGGGLSYLQRISREYSDLFVIDIKDNLDEIQGVSCRWDPIPSKKGVILSLLIKTKDGVSDDVYAKVFKFISGATKNENNPLNSELMTYRPFFEGLKSEYKMHAKLYSLSFSLRLAEYLLCQLIFKLKISPFFNRKNYINSMSTHSDYKKFDDTLSLVLDCTYKARDKIVNFLESNSNDINYGLHESKEVEMICYVESIKDGGHMHFIDGANGGYAIASKMLKENIKKNK